MKAAVIRKYGKPEVFQIEEMPEPFPNPKQVKVKIMASSVNPVDWKVRSGALAVLTGWKFPRILGGDFSGKVVECGLIAPIEIISLSSLQTQISLQRFIFAIVSLLTLPCLISKEKKVFLSASVKFLGYQFCT